jgi:rRNA maturation protein Nop10
MKTDSIIYSILLQKCPRCHQGDLFLDKNPYHLKKVYDMPDNCPVCGQSNLPEVGFWWGSMYISYGLSVGLSVATVLFLWLVMHWPDWAVLGTNALFMLVLLPVAFRYARSIWFHMFVRFDLKYSIHGKENPH